MKARIVYLYAFDVADEIRTSQVRELMSQKPFPFQIRVGATVPRDVPIYTPLTIALPVEEEETAVGRVVLKPYVKIFEVGVISVSYEVDVDVPDLPALRVYHQLAPGGAPLTTRAELVAAQVSESLKPFMVRPSAERPPVEAYTVFCTSDVDGPLKDWAQARRQDVAALLNEEEPGRLSSEQVDETWDNSLSYTVDDLTVIDWDAALVIDRSGYYDDVLYVIELANLQLEEYRLLDDRLDRLFDKAYDDLERYGGMRVLVTPATPLRSLRSIRMDITKMSEELSNITKFVGDWYLARVYLAAKDRFHLGTWEASVDQKLQELDRVYTIFMEEIQGRRMLLLEAMIVALFIIDLVAIFLLK